MMKMQIRNHFTADWAFGVKGAIESEVRNQYPKLLRQWPCLQQFDFEAYSLEDYFVIVLKDKISGLPSGPGELQEFPYKDYPRPPLDRQNASIWFSYLISKFDLRNEDIAMVLPIHDGGKNDAGNDYQLFTDQEKKSWQLQLGINLERQHAIFRPTESSIPNTSQNITYNVYGSNSRVNISSVDSSVNVINETPPEIFSELLSAVNAASASEAAITDISTSIEVMRDCHGTGGFGKAYADFMSTLANHMQVFGPIVAPYLPTLAGLVT